MCRVKPDNKLWGRKGSQCGIVLLRLQSGDKLLVGRPIMAAAAYISEQRLVEQIVNLRAGSLPAHWRVNNPPQDTILSHKAPQTVTEKRPAQPVFTGTWG